MATNSNPPKAPPSYESVMEKSAQNRKPAQCEVTIIPPPVNPGFGTGNVGPQDAKEAIAQAQRDAALAKTQAQIAADGLARIVAEREKERKEKEWADKCACYCCLPFVICFVVFWIVIGFI